MRLISSLKQDITFQYRHGFYYAYLVVTIIYIFILKFLPASYQNDFLVFVIFSDTSILGYFFIGGIVLLEKGQGILNNIFITPLRLYEYIISKALSLSFLSLLASITIVFFTHCPPINLSLFMAGVFLSNLCFTFLGLAISARSVNVNSYLLTASLIIIPFCLPLLAHFNILENNTFHLLPTYASLTLIKTIFLQLNNKVAIFAILSLLIWCYLTYLLAIRWFTRYVILRIGGFNDEKHVNLS